MIIDVWLKLALTWRPLIQLNSISPSLFLMALIQYSRCGRFITGAAGDNWNLQKTTLTNSKLSQKVHNGDGAGKTERQENYCKKKNLPSSHRDGNNPSETKSSEAHIIRLIHPSNTITKIFIEFSQSLGAKFKTDTTTSCSMTRKMGEKKNPIWMCVYC